MHTHIGNWLLESSLVDFESGRILKHCRQYRFIGYSKFCLVTHACYCDDYSLCLGSTEEPEEWRAMLQE